MALPAPVTVACRFSAMAVKTPVSILISGRGSNMEALAEAARRPEFPAHIVSVISNRPQAEGLARAGALDIPTRTLDHRDFSARETFDAALNAQLQADGAQWLCLAGFMRVLTADFIARWQGRILNIHPSLLPAFPGLHAAAQALKAGAAETGCTVHRVTSQVDAGPILAQARVPVYPGDTEETLSTRIRLAEHALYPAALALALSLAQSGGGT